MAVSQNGWQLINSTQLDASPIPGTNIVPVPGLLKGDATTLLHWVGTQFNAHVASLYNPGCWGWNAPTPIPGSSIYSNHCSGTAIDFNAPSFPWTKRTMTPTQRQACRVIVNQTDGVVAWGGDFTTTVDEMHFEINGTQDDVARIVKKLNGGNMNASREMLIEIYRGFVPNQDVNDEWVKKWTGKDINDALQAIRDDPSRQAYITRLVNNAAAFEAAKAPSVTVDKAVVLDYIIKNLK